MQNTCYVIKDGEEKEVECEFLIGEVKKLYWDISEKCRKENNCDIEIKNINYECKNIFPLFKNIYYEKLFNFMPKIFCPNNIDVLIQYGKENIRNFKTKFPINEFEISKDFQRIKCLDLDNMVPFLMPYDTYPTHEPYDCSHLGDVYYTVNEKILNNIYDFIKFYDNVESLVKINHKYMLLPSISAKIIFNSYPTFRIQNVENYYCKISNEDKCLFEKKVESFNPNSDNNFIKHNYVYHEKYKESKHIFKYLYIYKDNKDEFSYKLNNSDLIFRTFYNIDNINYVIYNKTFYKE